MSANISEPLHTCDYPNCWRMTDVRIESWDKKWYKWACAEHYVWAMGELFKRMKQLERVN